MMCDRHKVQRGIQDDIGECNDCRIESWLLELTEAFFELRLIILESETFVKESKQFNAWKRLESLEVSLKGFIEYCMKNKGNFKGKRYQKYLDE